MLKIEGVEPGIAAFHSEFRLSTGEQLNWTADRFDTVVAELMLDGDRVFTSLAPIVDGRSDENIVDTLLTDSTAVDEGPYRVAATAYVRWYRDLYSEPEHTDDGLSKAWNSERQEYEFAIASRTEEDELVLRASEYTGGRLDWYSFDRDTGSSLRTPPDDRDTQSIKRRVLPTPTTFRGAPRDRWFEFEDETVNLDRIHLERDNPAGAVLLEFALRYSNDWCTVPVDVLVRTVTRVTGLTVRDTFGEVTHIDRYGNVVNGGGPVRSENDIWELFAQTGDEDGGEGGSGPPNPPRWAREQTD